MNEVIIVALIAVVPFLISIAIRVNATLLFVAVVSGNLLVQQFSDDASLVVSSFVRSGDPMVIARLGLQFLPVMLMMIFARRTANKRMLVLQTVPLVFTCVLLALLSVALLPEPSGTAFYASSIGSHIQQSQQLIIGAAVATQLVYIWATQRPEHKKRSYHKHNG